MATTTSDLSGLFKQVYSPRLQNLIPEALHLVNDVKFTQREKVGDKYHQPVVLTQEQGFTYASNGAGAFAVNSAISMKMQDAQVDGSQLLLEANMDYETAARSENGNVAAFMDATRLQVENMWESIHKRLELQFLYGQTGIGVGDTSSNVNTTTTDVTILLSSWSPGIWSGLENAQIQFWTAANTLVSSGADSIFTVARVNPSTRVVRVTGTTTGISALDTALGAGDCDIYFNGSRTGASTFTEAAGLKKIITNTGTLFNIDAATFGLWKGNTFSAGSAALTFAKLQDSVAEAVARGLMEEVDVYVNVKSWSDLLTTEAGLRMYDSSYRSSNLDNGARKLSFYSQSGTMNIRPHIYVKEGDAFVVPMAKVKRIGATDCTFDLPGNKEIFWQLPANAGFGYRCYSHQALFLEAPAQATYISGIVN